MRKLVRFAEILGVVGTIAASADAIMKNDNIKAAVVSARERGRKIGGRISGRDAAGRRPFRYGKRKIAALYDRDRISEDVFDYLIVELKRADIIDSHARVFEKQFARIIRAKDEGERAKAVAKYEKIRDKLTECESDRD